MTDINPTPSWANVRQLETNEYAKGGLNGNMNEQAKSLAARSELLKQYAALPYESKTGGYALNERVQLATGDIVRSTIASNVNNPNENMTDWVKTNDASQIFDGILRQSTINYDLFNTPEKYGADSGATDNTAALQAWLNSSKVLHLRPFKVYKFSGTLVLSIEDQSIIGLTHQKYGQAKLLYTGSGTAINIPNPAGYLKFQSWQLAGNVVTSGAVYEAGTTAISTPSGTVIEGVDWYLQGFERLYSGAGNSYYNKFLYCRFSDFKDGFWNIAAYNCEFSGCRWNRFTTAIRAVGGSGPLNIKNNSFERFNGAIVDAISYKVLLNFKGNYVEIFDKDVLPVNFTPATNQTKGSFWGGNILFQGYFSSLNIHGNNLYIGGVFRVGNFSECSSLDSSGNVISIYTANNNLDKLYQSVQPYKSFTVNDTRFADLGANGGYSRTYLRSVVNLTNVRNKFFYFDCLLDKKQPLLAQTLILNPINGWSLNNANEQSVSAIVLDDGATFIGGALYGGIKTSNVALIVPVSHRPMEISTSQTTFIARCVNITDGVNVLFKYTYSNGELELLASTVPPPTLGNILLNFTIPPRR